MDDDWRYPYFRKPPYPINFNHQLSDFQALVEHVIEPCIPTRPAEIADKFHSSYWLHSEKDILHSEYQLIIYGIFQVSPKVANIHPSPAIFETPSGRSGNGVDWLLAGCGSFQNLPESSATKPPLVLQHGWLQDPPANRTDVSPHDPPWSSMILHFQGISPASHVWLLEGRTFY